MHTLPTSRVAAIHPLFTVLLLGALVAGCSDGSTSLDGKALIVSNDSLQVTFEGCNNDGSITFPANGPFICPDADKDYTTGNLGKGWNELDLVPHRITFATARSFNDDGQQHSARIALDYNDEGKPGYDALSAPVLNTALSTGTCTITSTPSAIAHVVNGTDLSIVRELTIVQAKDTVCVFDFHARLAIGAHLWPGSSLQAALLRDDGARTVPLPVNEALPPDLSKSMSAVQDSNQTWSIAKGGTSNVNFGDVCDADGPAPQPVAVTVTWTKLQAVPGYITAVATINGTNNASRPLTFVVTDQVYDGPKAYPQVAPAVGSPETFTQTVPAHTSMVVATHTATLPADTGAIDDFLSDVASSVILDPVVGGPPIGELLIATADDQIGAGTTTNGTVTIGDSESITGAGLTFSSDSPTSGYTGYTAGTQTTGPVDWSSGSGLSSSGSQVFNKTIYLGPPWVTSGMLSDTATLTGSSGFTDTTTPFNVAAISSASVSLTINKAIPADYLFPGDTASVTFTVTRDGSSEPQTVTMTFTGGGESSQSTTLSGLTPGTYTVQESAVTFTPDVYPALNDASGSTRSVSLRGPLASENSPPFSECSGSVSFNNTQTLGRAHATVQKVTTSTDGDTGGTWSFLMTGTGMPSGGETATTAGNGSSVQFAFPLREGTYTITETQQTGWDQTSATGCTISVDYSRDDGKSFGCVFHNTKRGKASVLKTFQDAPLTGTMAFMFQLRTGASLTAYGTVIESRTADAGNNGAFTFDTWLVPENHYQLCETGIAAGWGVNFGTFVPGQFNPPGINLNPAVDNSTVCVDFTVQPGQVQSFTINNTPPPATNGGARTIGYWKNWASCSGGKQKPVLDQTLAAAPGGGILIGDLFVDTCTEAVRILNKSRVDNGKKMASDPAFNMAAQLLAAKLNQQAGAAVCTGVLQAINQAQALLAGDPVNFTGNSHGPISASTGSTMNSLATTLDRYNNNLFCS